MGNGEIIHREGANLTLELKVNDDDKRHGAEHIPNELILRYGEGWYNKKTLTESITIPHRDNYYYVGSYYVEKKNPEYKLMSKEYKLFYCHYLQILCHF